MSNSSLNIGAAQFASVIGNVDANIDTHSEWIDKAHSENVDLLVMPEVSLTGHYGAEDVLTVAMKRTDHRLIRLAEAARDMIVVVGFIEEGPAAQFYNAAVMLHQGKIVHLHRKINLPTYGNLEEGKHYAAGRFIETFDIDEDWRAGLLICADVWNPALTHLAFLHGATVLVSPVSSGVEAVDKDFDNPGNWALTMRFYSMMYGSPSVMANRTGTEKGMTFWGGSRIINAFGEEIAVAGDSPELITGRIHYDDVRKARRLLPTVRDSNIDLVQREINRLVGKLGVPDSIRNGG